jgi:hypothetical protein
MYWPSLPVRRITWCDKEIWYAEGMTKSLQAAIECLRQFPPDVQDRVARILISQLEEEPGVADI